MSDFEDLHPRANPERPGAFSERQQSPPQAYIDEHAARDRENLHAELAQIQRTCSAIAVAGKDQFFADPAELGFLAACMAIVRFDDLATNRLSAEAKASRQDVPWGSISGMRNLLSHDYRSSQKPLVWTTITKELPALLDDLLADESL